MTATTETLLNDLLQQNLPPEELTLQAALLLSRAAHADWAGLYIGNSNARTFQTVYQHPELPTPLLAYLEQRVRSRRPPLTHGTLGTQPTFFDNYRNHPDAQSGALILGVQAVAHFPLGRHRDRTFIATALRVTPTLTHGSPWTPVQRTLMQTIAVSVQANLTRTSY
jgi:hypothetical protein